MDITWIVSANTGRAQIFSEPNPVKPLEEIESMVNPAARLGTSDTYTDRLGPMSAGKSIHNTGGALPSKQYEPAQSPEEREAESFAKDISAYLLKAKQAGRFDKLGLVAAPGFLGVLRKFLDPQLKGLLSFEINKDYSQSNGQRLREQLRAHADKA